VTDGGSSINLAGSGGNAPGLSKRLKTGQVFLKADPYADVYVDGKKLMELMGTTTHTLSAGNHVIEFRNEKKTQKFPIKIVSGATVDVVFNARGN
jgi:N-glycosylase/DNA lyase